MVKRQQGVSSTVLKWLQENRGIAHPVEDIMRDTGLERSQVTSAISALKNNNNFDITSPTKGWYMLRADRGTGVSVEQKGTVLAMKEDGSILFKVGDEFYRGERVW